MTKLFCFDNSVWWSLNRRQIWWIFPHILFMFHRVSACQWLWVLGDRCELIQCILGFICCVCTFFDHIYSYIRLPTKVNNLLFNVYWIDKQLFALSVWEWYVQKYICLLNLWKLLSNLITQYLFHFLKTHKLVKYCDLKPQGYFTVLRNLKKSVK